MARPNLRGHRKFRRLVFLLGMPAPHILGHLEFVWQAAYESGDERIGDRVDLELAAEWPGEKGAFAQASIDAGFFDEDEHGVVTVHDLWDHAPDYVERRAKKEADRRMKGKTLSEIRAESGRRGGLARVANLKQTKMETKHSGRVSDEPGQMSGKNQANAKNLLGAGSNLLESSSKRQATASTPAPAPAPAPLGTREESPYPLVAKPDSESLADGPLGFDVFWLAYPRKMNQEGARAAARALERQGKWPGAKVLLEAIEAQGLRNRQTHFVPSPAKWLSEKRFEDDPAAYRSGRGSMARRDDPRLFDPRGGRNERTGT